MRFNEAGEEFTIYLFVLCSIMIHHLIKRKHCVYNATPTDPSVKILVTNMEPSLVEFGDRSGSDAFGIGLFKHFKGISMSKVGVKSMASKVESMNYKILILY